MPPICPFKISLKGKSAFPQQERRKTIKNGNNRHRQVKENLTEIHLYAIVSKIQEDCKRAGVSMSLDENRWLSMSDICAYLGVSNDTVYKWIDKHSMPAHRMGRLWKFKRDEVDSWVRSGGAIEQQTKTDSSAQSNV